MHLLSWPLASLHFTWSTHTAVFYLEQWGKRVPFQNLLVIPPELLLKAGDTVCNPCFAEKHEQVCLCSTTGVNPPCLCPKASSLHAFHLVHWNLLLKPNCVANAQYWVLFRLVSKALGFQPWAQFPVLKVFRGLWGVHLGCGPLSCWGWKVSSSGRQNHLSMQHLSN